MTMSQGRSWARRHPDIADLAVATVFGVVVFGGTLVQRGTETDAVLAAASLGLAVGAVLLWSLRRRRDRTQRQAQAMLEQRLDIARELHDVVAHHVSIIGIQAAAARRTLGRSPDETAFALTAIEASSRAAVEEMQRLVTTLRRDDDQGSGSSEQSPAPPAPTLADLPGLCREMEATGLRVDAIGLDEDRSATVPASAQVALYRVAQEALTNAIRHGGAVAVTVALADTSGALVLSVEHGPGGSTRPPTLPGGGLGIPGMRERMGAVGGTLDAGPTPSGGFAVVARVPIGRRAGLP